MNLDNRFIIKQGFERSVIDTETGRKFVFSWKSDAEDICSLLNELLNENIDLKRDFQDYEDAVNGFFIEHEFDFNSDLKQEIGLELGVEFEYE